MSRLYGKRGKAASCKSGFDHFRCLIRGLIGFFVSDEYLFHQELACAPSQSENTDEYFGQLYMFLADLQNLLPTVKVVPLRSTSMFADLSCR